ncbi:MAG: DUF1902 domain-containing protein [Magnetococcales bacterium]|nr:DUF1902 domain-containing protein [Magnetococcales bacterium]
MNEKRQHHSRAEEFEIKAVWDPEAKVWYVGDSDVPGLVTEAATLESLTEKIVLMIPDLLRMNNREPLPTHHVPFKLTGEMHGKIEISV